jgi:hypothetical protein
MQGFALHPPETPSLDSAKGFHPLESHFYLPPIFLLKSNSFYTNIPVRNAPRDAANATTISGQSKNASITAIIVPAAAVITLPVL